MGCLVPGKDDIGHVDHLLVGDGRASMCRQSREIFNGIEDDVDWQGDVEVEVGDLYLFRLDLLRSELSIGGEQVKHEVSDTGGVLAGCTVEKGTEVDGVDGIDHLGNESFFSRLAKFIFQGACGPDITSSVDLCRSTCCWRYKRTGMGRINPCSGWL